MFAMRPGSQPTWNSGSPTMAGFQAMPAARPTKGSKAYVLADFEKPTAEPKPVCLTCRSKLTIEEAMTVIAAIPGQRPCQLCSIAEEKPEAFTKPFCDFLTENPTVFHAVDYFKKKLDYAGFTEVRRRAAPYKVSLTFVY